jgi:hypothetical protein
LIIENIVGQIVNIEEDFKGMLEINYKSQMMCDKENNFGMQLNVMCNHRLEEKKYNIISVKNDSRCNPVVNL